MNTVLTNLTFMNTRPAHQAEPLNQLLISFGAKTINFPTLEIEATNTIKTQSICQQLKTFDIAIFVSANAAHYSHAYWPLPFPIPTVIAIGPGTEKTLNKYGIAKIILPNYYNSKGILALPELNPAQNKKIIIFCGKDPKPLLYKTLSEQNARVTRCECYQRIGVNPSQNRLAILDNKKLDGIISTSQESLKTLNTLLKNHAYLKKVPLIVISAEMKTLAKAQGWQKIVISSNASNEAIVKTLISIAP